MKGGWNIKQSMRGGLMLCLLVWLGNIYSFGQEVTLVDGERNDTLQVPLYNFADSIASAVPAEATHSPKTLVAYLQQHLHTPTELVRGIYKWISCNIKYNVYTSFVPHDEAEDEKKIVLNTLQSRQGVCHQYALLFRSLALQGGIPCYVVGGYNKADSVLLPDPHEWCVAKIDTRWYCFDPTWGAGYIENYRFVAHPNDRYFMLSPQQMKDTHMPFDPLWQLTERPLTYPEFDKGVVDSLRAVPSFHWQDTLQIFMQQGWIERLESANNRIQANGAPNALVNYIFQVNLANIKIGYDAKVITVYNQAKELLNTAIDSLNIFINYRNRMFEPPLEEKQVRTMISVPEQLIGKADSLMRTIYKISAKHKATFLRLREAIVDMASRIYGQKLFLDQYYATPPKHRKDLFYKEGTAGR